MRRKLIVWGTCWLYEEAESLCSFMKRAINTFNEMGMEVCAVVFDAAYKRNENEIEKVKEDIGCIVIKNMLEIYPNKNYGVAVISKIAYKIGADYVAVVDSDWEIKDFDRFINHLFYPLLKEEQELVIPDISTSAGRCNILIGQQLLALFYPEYADKIPTAFPGAFLGKTRNIYEITSRITYHFDWGGEWDIIADSCKMNMRITSPVLGMQNIRHRSNDSKTYDSFQIWRACLENLEEDRLSLLNNLHENSIRGDSFAKMVLSLEMSATKQIEKLMEWSKYNKLSKTQLQLIYMVLFPLSAILDDKCYYETLMDIVTDTGQPYERDELYELALLVPHCVRAAIDYSGKNLEMIRESASNSHGRYFGEWNAQGKVKAMGYADSQIKRMGL